MACCCYAFHTSVSNKRCWKFLTLLSKQQLSLDLPDISKNWTDIHCHSVFKKKTTIHVTKFLFAHNCWFSWSELPQTNHQFIVTKLVTRVNGWLLLGDAFWTFIFLGVTFWPKKYYLGTFRATRTSLMLSLNSTRFFKNFFCVGKLSATEMMGESFTFWPRLADVSHFLTLSCPTPLWINILPLFQEGFLTK